MNNLVFSSSMLPILGAMFIEGSSIPFPGIVLILAFSSTIRPSFKETVILAFFMAITYTIATFIPYAIGRKFGNKILSIFERRKKVKQSIGKGRNIVKRYGIFTIAISRFFGWGNKISYIAGISKMRYLPYGILTFTGIYTWSLVMMNLGKIFKGDIKVVLEIIEKYTMYLYIVMLVVAIIYITAMIIRYRNKIKTQEK